MNDIERLELVLDVEDSKISIDELIPILQGFEGMAQSINDTLNKVCSSGYDKLIVEVAGLEHGSFKIPLRVKKIGENLFCSTVSNVLSTLIVSCLMVSDGEKITHFPDDNIELTRENMNKNKKTRQSASLIANTVLNSDNIQGMKLVYYDENAQKVVVDISKEQLSELETSEDDDVTIENIDNVKLEIVSPTLEAKPVQWKVRYNNKVRSMRMNDLAFLDLIEKRDIAFSKGDFIVCDIQISEIENIDGCINKKYVITRVHEFPRYHKIEK